MYYDESFEPEEIEKQHEELLRIFLEDISHLSDKTIRKHIDNVAFFINDYLVYYNLEARVHSFEGTVEVQYSKADEFESTHKIIVPKNVVSRDSYFYNLQEEYYETAILESEDKAIEKVNRLVRKYK